MVIDTGSVAVVGIDNDSGLLDPIDGGRDADDGAVLST